MKPYFLIASLAVIASSTTFAQTTNSQTPRLDARQARQEARINQGAASGALTTKEANRLEAGQDRLQAAEDKTKADGVVTNAERAKLEHKADVQSRHIARQKTDRQTDRNHDGKRDRPARP